LILVFIQQPDEARPVNWSSDRVVGREIGRMTAEDGDSGNLLAKVDGTSALPQARLASG
jgi:hypothetical protein